MSNAVLTNDTEAPHNKDAAQIPVREIDTDEDFMDSKDNVVIDLEEKTVVEQDYPTGLKLAGIIFGLCCAIFVVALDQTIIATASMTTSKLPQSIC